MGTHAAVSVRPAVVSRARFFYVVMAAFAAGVVFLGFARTYYLKEIFGTPPLPWVLHLHGAIMTCWITLFIVQTTLVASHRTDIHRRLGIFGAFLAAAVIVIGVTVAIYAARLGHHPPLFTALGFMAVPLGDIFVFAILVTAALYYRRRSELHKRLMLTASIGILPAGLARWPISLIHRIPVIHPGITFAFIFTDLTLMSCVAYDCAKTRRLSPAFLWAGLLLIVSHPLRLMLSGTVVWMKFAHWITGV